MMLLLIFLLIIISVSFRFKTKVAGITGNDGTKNVKIRVPLKYLSNVWRTPEMPLIEVGRSPSRKNCVICFIESPLKMMENGFYFILKALFVLKIFKILSLLFGHVGKKA